MFLGYSQNYPTERTGLYGDIITDCKNRTQMTLCVHTWATPEVCKCRVTWVAFHLKQDFILFFEESVESQWYKKMQMQTFIQLSTRSWRRWRSYCNPERSQALSKQGLNGHLQVLAASHTQINGFWCPFYGTLNWLHSQHRWRGQEPSLCPCQEWNFGLPGTTMRYTVCLITLYCTYDSISASHSTGCFQYKGQSVRSYRQTEYVIILWRNT